MKKLDLALSKTSISPGGLATIVGGAYPLLFLSFAAKWTEESEDSDGWFCKNHSEMREEMHFMLSQKRFPKVIQSLQEIGILETRKTNATKATFYRVNEARAMELVAEFLKKKNGQEVEA